MRQAHPRNRFCKIADLLVAALFAVFVMPAAIAKPQQAPSYLIKSDAIVAVDASHAAIQRRLIKPWEHRSARSRNANSPDWLVPVYIEVARDLLRLLVSYQQRGINDWRVGVIAADAAHAAAGAGQQAAAENMFDGAEKTLVNYLGHNEKLDLVYAQMAWRWAQFYTQPGRDNSRVAPLTLRAMRTLKQHGASAAEGALVEAWASAFKDSQRYFGFDEVIRYALNEVSPSAPCRGSYELASASAEFAERDGDVAKARRIAEQAARQFIDDVRARCEGDSPSHQLINRLDIGKREPLIADVNEATLKSNERAQESQWSRASTSGVPYALVAIAKHGTLEQLKRALALVASHVSFSYAEALPSAVALGAAGPLEYLGDFASAETLYEKAIVLAREERQKEYADAIYDAAVFHDKHGRRSRASELAAEFLTRKAAESTDIKLSNQRTTEQYASAQHILASQSLTDNNAAQASERLVDAVTTTSEKPDLLKFKLAVHSLQQLKITLSPIQVTQVVNALIRVREHVMKEAAANQPQLGIKQNHAINDQTRSLLTQQFILIGGTWSPML